MNAFDKHPDERGFALILTLFVVMVIGAIATGAALIGSNNLLVNKYYSRGSTLEVSADAGIEVARATINGDNTLYPDSGYTVLESGVPVNDGSGSPIPGVRRWLYAGPTGVTSGQYGVFGSIISVVKDDGGGAAIRRLQVYQESFAKYAYFTDFEPSYIKFGGGDQIFGPVHTNDYLKIYSSGATFHGKTQTAKSVQGASYGTFMQGYDEYVPAIPMPQTADLTKLATQGAAGGTSFSGDGNGGHGEATTRIEFVALDLNVDGDITDDDEGFLMVYQSPDWAWLGAERTSSWTTDINCGRPINGGVDWQPLSTQYTIAGDNNRRCYLGGSDILNDVVGGNLGAFVPNDGRGAWLPWTGPIDPRVTAAVAALGRPGKELYLFPISRKLNPNFKGVVYVDGKTGVSGTLRGRVTLAATNDIIFFDDITYATNPGAGTCQDILGLFSQDDIVVGDNKINAPYDPGSGPPNYDYLTWDDTKDEFFHSVVLALDIFTVENYDSGSSNDEWCETVVWGRGCLYLTGGIIQRTRGAVGLTSGRGNLKRYSYDACAASEPPPYFPTTGHFTKGQYYQVDPTGWSVDAYFQMLTPP